MNKIWSSLVLAMVLVIPAGRAQDGQKSKPALPPPDFAEVAYGPHARNVLDVWLAKSGRPTPVLIFIHGGGFMTGSKSNLSPAILKAALNAGISVVSTNYRFSPEVVFPAHYLDGARALQFVRHSARTWNLDPARVALSGSSAGAGTSLWIAFHDDLADPAGADPIARESTRVSCVVVMGAQPSYDPRVIRALAGESAARHQALRVMYGLQPDEVDSARAHELYERAAPVTYLTADDPPVFAYYSEARATVPVTAKAGTGIHHPNLGLYLQQNMQAVGLECVLTHRDDGDSVAKEGIMFLRRHLFPQPEL